jgi:hypothetical protein
MAAQLLYADIEDLHSSDGGLDAFLFRMIDQTEEMNTDIYRASIAYPIADEVM